MHSTDLLFYGHRSLMRGLDGIQPDAWQQDGVCGVWSVKDVMAHMASYERMLGEVLGTFLGHLEKPTWEIYQAGNGANDREVEARLEHNQSQVLEEYEVARNIVDERIQLIPQETMREAGTIPWYGDKFDLEDYVIYVGYGHKREHAAQFNVYKDSLKG